MLLVELLSSLSYLGEQLHSDKPDIDNYISSLFSLKARRIGAAQGLALFSAHSVCHVLNSRLPYGAVLLVTDELEVGNYAHEAFFNTRPNLLTHAVCLPSDGGIKGLENLSTEIISTRRQVYVVLAITSSSLLVEVLKTCMPVFCQAPFFGLIVVNKDKKIATHAATLIAEYLGGNTNNLYFADKVPFVLAAKGA